MSSQLCYTDQLAGAFLNVITSHEFDDLNRHAILFASVMGMAPESDTVYCVMSQAGNALAKYMHAQSSSGKTYVIKDLIETFISQLTTTHAIPLACIIIGYSGRQVGPNETYSGIMKSVGAVIAKYDKSVTAAPTMLPYKPCPEVIAMVETVLKSEHTRCDDLRRVAEFTGVHVDDIYNLVDSEICIREQLKARLWGAIAQWKRSNHV
jgi:hypothetical protein